MRHLIARVGSRLAVALILVVLAGCAGAQEPARTGATPTASAGVTKPASTASADVTNPPSTASAGVTNPTPSEQAALPEDCSYDFNSGRPMPDVPPAPADVSGMMEWLAMACPGATWLTRITKIEHVPGEVPDSGGYANAIVVTTDLDFATEQVAALEIGPALGEAHPSWADQYVVWYADGHNETAGDIIDWTP